MPASSPISRFFHKSLARCSWGVKAAVALRSFGQGVVAEYVLPSHDPHKNGQCSLAERVAHHCNTFIEVGAKRGAWVEFFLKRSEPAGPNGLLFEPYEPSARELNARYGDSLQVEVVQAAVGHVVGEADFFEKPVGARHYRCLTYLGMRAQSRSAILSQLSMKRPTSEAGSRLILLRSTLKAVMVSSCRVQIACFLRTVSAWCNLNMGSDGPRPIRRCVQLLIS